MNRLLIEIAKNELGTHEVPGLENNPRILYYARCSGLDWVKNDETSWCGIFLSWCMTEIPEFMRPDWPKSKAATARQWLNYGVDVPLGKAKPGDIVVFWRESPESWKGHCALYLDQDSDRILCLGGNQGNAVCERWYKKVRLLGLKRY